MRNIGIASFFSTDGLVRAFAWLIRVGCIVVVLLVAADAVWYFMIGPVDRTKASTAQEVATQSAPKIDTARLLATELFGSSEAAEDVSSLAELQETTLSLTLEGTVVATDDQSHSIAFISNRNQRGGPREYRIGDTVASFSEIAEIHPRTVVIARAGERELLTFDGDQVFSEHPDLMNQPLAPATELNRPNATEPRPATGGLTPQQQIRSVSEINPTLIKEATLEDLAPLGLTTIQTNEGAMLALADSAGSSPLARLGLQPGDVVVSVNGYSYDALRSDELLAHEVLGESTARLEINRSGRAFYLTVPLP